MDISFICWSNDDTKFKDMRQHALNSLSMAHTCEFVCIEEQGISMAEAYQRATDQARGDILVYLHNDCNILDTRFGERITKLFKEHPEIGFAGPVGSIELSGGSWWEVGPSNCRGGVMQGSNPLWFGAYDGPARQLDALMMVTNKRFKFPVNELPGMHFLDLWMCREAELQGYTNWIFWTVVQHLSGGENTSEHYHRNREIYKKKFGL